MSKKIPRYCHHKPTGQAFVRLNGRQVYLGKYDSPESKAEYDRLIVDWLRKAETTASYDINVAEVILHFWRHCKKRYGSAGKGRYGSAVNWRPILRLMKKHFGKRPVSKFGPKALKSLFDEMIELGWSRRYINDQLARGKQAFKWAASEELIPTDVYTRLTTVEGLRRGQTKARERAAVRPVDDELVNSTLPFMPEVPADMVRLQRLTGARPAEICILRPCDVNRSGDVWIYVPASHKTEHHGKSRRIYIGPQAQAVLQPYLLRSENSFCFEPKRKGCGKKYTTDSYRRAIHRGCEKRWNESRKQWEVRHPGEAFQEPIVKWAPNQLRHTAGTAVRAAFDAETAQAVLGHSNLRTTEIYAEKSELRAIAAAQKLG